MPNYRNNLLVFFLVSFMLALLLFLIQTAEKVELLKKEKEVLEKRTRKLTESLETSAKKEKELMSLRAEIEDYEKINKALKMEELESRAISITSWRGGSNGNHIRMLWKSAKAAAVLGCDLIVPPKTFLGHSGRQQLIFKPPGNLGCCHKNELLEIYRNISAFWWSKLPSGPAYQELEKSMNAYYAENRSRVDSKIYDFLGHNETHAGGLPCSRYRFDVAMHVRAGDVMQGKYDSNDNWIPGKVHPNYGQPAMSYYINCLDENLQPGQRAVAVCQDFTNPVAAELRMMAKFPNLFGNLTVVQLPLNETVATLGCTPIVCKAEGTFFSLYRNPFHTRKMVGADKDEITKTNNGTWRNTAKQREAMLEA